MADALGSFKGLWDVPRRTAVGETVDEHRLGFLKRGELAQVALDAALSDIVKPLADIGVTLSDAEFRSIFGVGVGVSVGVGDASLQAAH